MQHSLKRAEVFLTTLALLLIFPLSVVSKPGVSLPFGFLGFAALSWGWREKKIDVLKNPVFLILLPLPLIGLFFESASALKVLFLFTIGAFVVVYLRDQRPSLAPLLWGGLAAIVLIAIQIFFNFSFFQVSFHKGLDLRVFNNFTMLLVFMLWIFIERFVTTQDMKKKVGNLLAVGLFLGAVFWLKHDTAKYCVILGGLTWMLALSLKPRVMQVLMALTITVAVLGMPFIIKNYMAPQQVERLVPISKRSFFHRILIWNFVANEVVNDPLKLRGFDKMRHMTKRERRRTWKPYFKTLNLPGVFKETGAKYKPPHHPHNASLQVWYEFGALGSLLFLGMLLVLLRACSLFSERVHQATAYSLFTTVITLFHASYGLWETRWWMMAFIAVGLLPFTRK